MLTRAYIWVPQVVCTNWNDSIFGYTNSGFRKNVLFLITIMMMTLLLLLLLLHIRFQRGGVIKFDKIGSLRYKDFINI